jgi:predicted ABC-type ATPase
MALSYYVIYRLEVQGEMSFLDTLVVRGCIQHGDTWYCYTSEGFARPVLSLKFKEMREEGNAVVGVTSDSVFKFIPVTVDDVKQNFKNYLVTAEEAAAIQRPSDLFLVMFDSALPEFYEDTYGPKEEQTESRTLDLDFALLNEGKSAPTGTVHYWASRGKYFKKQADGEWFPIETASAEPAQDAAAQGDEWRDSDPSLPQDSLREYIDVRGHLTPERQKLHDAIVGRLFMGKTRTASPTAILTMGLPASGKSSLSRQLVQEQGNNVVSLDPDDHREHLPEYQKAKTLKVRSGAKIVHNEVTRLNDEALEKAIADDPDYPGEKFNILLDGVGGNAEWYGGLIDRLKQRGYAVRLLMAHAKGDNPESGKELLKRRAERRGQETGRFIDPNQIERLYSVLPENFEKLKHLVDNAAVFDTTDLGDAKLLHSVDNAAKTMQGSANWRNEGTAVLSLRMEERVDNDFDALCALYIKALNKDANTPRTVKCKVGEGIVDPLLDPVAVPVSPKGSLAMESKVGTVLMANGNFYEKQPNGTWVKVDWFP